MRTHGSPAPDPLLPVIIAEIDTGVKVRMAEHEERLYERERRLDERLNLTSEAIKELQVISDKWRDVLSSHTMYSVSSSEYNRDHRTILNNVSHIITIVDKKISDIMLNLFVSMIFLTIILGIELISLILQ